VVRAVVAVRRAFERVRAALRAAVFRWRLAAERLARALRCVAVVVRFEVPPLRLLLVLRLLALLRLRLVPLLVLRRLLLVF
jgi:hypothetical protein